MTKKRWARLSEDEERQSYQKASQGGMDILQTTLPQFKPANGDNTVRILPKFDDDLYPDHPFGCTVTIYFIEGEGYVLSPNIGTVRGVDPIAKAFKKAKVRSPEIDEFVSPQRKIIMHILNMNNNDEGELNLWACPITLAQDIVRISKLRNSSQQRSLENPDRGQPVWFTKTGEMLATRYSNIQLDPEPYPIGDELIDDIHYWDEILVPKPIEELEAIAENILEMADSVAPSRTRDDYDHDKGKRGNRSRKDHQDDDDFDSPPVGRESRSRTRGDQDEPEYDDDVPSYDRPSSRKGRGDEEETRSSRDKSDRADRQSRRGRNDNDNGDDDARTREVRDNVRDRTSARRGRRD